MKIILKPVERNDLEWLVTQRNYPDSYVLFNQPVPLSYDQEVDWYEKQVLTQKTIAYIIYLNRLKIGYIALQNVNWIVRSAEISHFIIPNVNPALTIYAHNTILEIAFENLNLNRIYSVCFNHNHIFEKLKIFGFKSEGTLRQSCFKEGVFGDSQMIALLRDEWKPLQPGVYG